MTYPQIGNYGVNLDDTQSAKPALRGLVVHDMCRTPSNWRSSMALPEFLERESIVAIEASILVRLFAIFAISVRRALFYPPKILTLLRSRKGRCSSEPGGPQPR